MTDSKIKDLSNKFKNWTRGSRSLSTLTSERFPPIHAQVIASNLNIIDKGKNDGEHNLPATNATQLSATELAIKSEIEKHQKSYLETFSKNMETNKARYLECTQLWDLHLIKNEERIAIELDQKIEEILDCNKKINEVSNEDDEVEAELKKLGIFNTILNILYKRKF